MQPLSLPVSLSLNRALNQDHTTALRSLSLVQGQTYDVTLSFYSGQTPVAPALDDFAFILRNAGGANVVSVTSLGGSHFSLPLVAPAIQPGSNYQGLLSFRADGEIEIIEAFPVRIGAGTVGGIPTAYVSTVNGASGDLTLSGAGSVSITKSGQTFSIFGSAPTGDYYPAANPSGFIGTSALAPYATTSYVNSVSGELTAQIASAGGSPSGVVFTSGNQTISGQKNFLDGLQAASIADSAGNPKLLCDAKSLEGGAWSLGLVSARIATEPWSATATLTKITPAYDGTPATSASLQVDMSQWVYMQDGDTFQIFAGGGFALFEWDNDSNVGDGRYGVNMSDPGQNLASQLSAVLGSYCSVNWDGNNVNITSRDGGSSSSISISQSLGGGSYSPNQSANGSDGTEGTPEAGTRLAELKEIGNAACHYITEVAVYIDVGGPWGNADIEIGYYNGGTFQVIATMSRSDFNSGFTRNFSFNGNDPTAMYYYFNGRPGQHIYCRTGSAGSVIDENVGSDATVYVRGYSITA